MAKTEVDWGGVFSAPGVVLCKITSVWVRRILYRSGNYSDNDYRTDALWNKSNKLWFAFKKKHKDIFSSAKFFYIFFISKDEVKMVFKPFSLIIFFMFVKKTNFKNKKNLFLEVMWCWRRRGEAQLLPDYKIAWLRPLEWIYLNIIKGHSDVGEFVTIQLSLPPLSGE